MGTRLGSRKESAEENLGGAKERVGNMEVFQRIRDYGARNSRVSGPLVEINSRLPSLDLKQTSNTRLPKGSCTVQNGEVFFRVPLLSLLGLVKRATKQKTTDLWGPLGIFIC